MFFITLKYQGKSSTQYPYGPVAIAALFNICQAQAFCPKNVSTEASEGAFLAFNSLSEIYIIRKLK